jgi:hypothetical protein
MPDWNTRLAVSYVDEDNNTVDITPITSFTPTFALNAEVLHSLEATHIGVVYAPQALSFSLTVPAIGDVAGKLTLLALQGKHFNVTLQEATGTDWSFKSVVLSQCIITNAQPTTANISGAPAATFSGFSLAASAELASGAAAGVP